MPEALSITAPFLAAVVLVWSAIGKLRDPASASEGFAALHVPPALSRPWMIRAHPWVEIALAVLLVVGAGWLGAVGAVGSLVLVLAYLGLVARAVQRRRGRRLRVLRDLGPGAGDGADGVAQRLARRVGRTVGVGRDGRPVAAVPHRGADAGWWVVGLAAALLTAGLVVAWGSSGASPGSEQPQYTVGDDLDDYVRTRTPAVPVRLADGSTRTLRQLSATRAPAAPVRVGGMLGLRSRHRRGARVARGTPQVDIRLVVARRCGVLERDLDGRTADGARRQRLGAGHLRNPWYALSGAARGGRAPRRWAGHAAGRTSPRLSTSSSSSSRLAPEQRATG